MLTETTPKVESVCLFQFFVWVKLFTNNLISSAAWRFTALNKGTTTSFDQLDLFWGSNPRVVIVITQFLQFGYALGLAGVFSFSKSWQGYEVIAHMEFLLLIILLSYSIFIKLISDILPWCVRSYLCFEHI